MSGWGGIDLTVADPTASAIRVIPLGEPKVVQTVPVPLPEPRPAVALIGSPPASVPVSSATNVCTKYGKKKVMTRGGKSWRCR
jgi:hypothetical protein